MPDVIAHTPPVYTLLLHNASTQRLLVSVFTQCIYTMPDCDCTHNASTQRLIVVAHTAPVNKVVRS
jgi:hypothetical protein